MSYPIRHPFIMYLLRDFDESLFNHVASLMMVGGDRLEDLDSITKLWYERVIFCYVEDR